MVDRHEGSVPRGVRESERRGFGPYEVVQIAAMDKTIRKYGNLEEMKADEIREWQQLSAAERMEAVAEMTLAAYRIKGLITDVPRLERTLVRLQQPES
jgi:hypothetical protein